MARGLRATGFFRTLWRLARQLFHEVTGALFAVMALAMGLSAVRNWRSGSPRWTVYLAGAFAALMAFFAVAAFRSSRRVK